MKAARHALEVLLSKEMPESNQLTKLFQKS